MQTLNAVAPFAEGSHSADPVAPMLAAVVHHPKHPNYLLQKGICYCVRDVHLVQHLLSLDCDEHAQHVNVASDRSLRQHLLAAPVWPDSCTVAKQELNRLATAAAAHHYRSADRRCECATAAPPVDVADDPSKLLIQPPGEALARMRHGHHVNWVHAAYNVCVACPKWIRSVVD
jgi:hypothetical protein